MERYNGFSKWGFKTKGTRLYYKRVIKNGKVKYKYIDVLETLMLIGIIAGGGFWVRHMLLTYFIELI